ncbi:hypothetical protein B0H14DRAFT_3478966 [Mycena olivaceomarginata]|nr:hypothetical protein B0H14DRAFT_3478966 [Mycena olivaceomarginata]
MTRFLNVEAGFEPGRHALLCRYIRWLQGSLIVALAFIQRPDAEPMCVVADASLSTRRKIAQIQGVHAADADRMHTDSDLRPLLVEPPRSSSNPAQDVAERVADHELYPMICPRWLQWQTSVMIPGA